MRVGKLDRRTRLLCNLSMFDHHFALVIGHGQAQKARFFIELVTEAGNRSCGAIHFRQERPSLPMAELLLELIMKALAQLRHSTVFDLKRSQVDAGLSLESVIAYSCRKADKNILHFCKKCHSIEFLVVLQDIPVNLLGELL